MSITQTINSASEYAMIRERDDAIDRLNRAESGVTVCIPTFNDADQLPKAVASALQQTVKPVEVIVVDDGSDTPVSLTWAHEGIDVRVVRVTNRGLPAARNVALMLARGHAIAFLDADDAFEPVYIEKTLPLLADADVVLTGLQECGPPPRNCAYRPGYNMPFSEVSVDDLWRENKFFYAALFRTQMLREVGGYNTFMAGGYGIHGGREDHDLWIDLMTRGMRFAAVDDPLLRYSTSNPTSMIHRAERNREALLSEMRRHHRR